MILVDANLLLYAVNSDSPWHPPARAWLEETLSGSAALGLAWNVILAFVRITTRAGIFARPLAPEEAIAYVDSWIEQPNVRQVVPGPSHWLIFRSLIHHTGTAGNLSSDAHLAALAIEQGYRVYSADNDFRRFPGIEHLNPLS